MNFRAEFFPKPFSTQLKHTDRLMLIGSCFTEQIGNKLSAHKFNVISNPNGILFNPVSISHAMKSYASGKIYTEEDLFYNNELWSSWQHHTSFSDCDKEVALNKINDSQTKAVDALKKADWILVTLGSAFIYERVEAASEDYENVAANCHKIPNDKFNRRLPDVNEITRLLDEMISAARSVKTDVRFIFTISPVRHLREGFIENNRSKAALINAVHSVCDNRNIFYFPAYELIIDDLRDYRFYAEDLVHPNYAATNYVWEKFTDCAIDASSKELMKEINIINAAKSHRPFNPSSEAHKRFMSANLDKVKKLLVQYPYLDMAEESVFFAKHD